MEQFNAKIFSEWARGVDLPREEWVYFAIVSYLKISKLDIEAFKSGSQSFTLLEENAKRNCENYEHVLKHLPENVVTLDQIHFISELALSDAEARSLGAVYTPSFIVEELLSNTVGEVDLDPRKVSFIDPCCGSGNFLTAAIVKIAELGATSFREASSRVAGIDINPVSISYTSAILDVLCYQENGEFSQARLVCMDSATTPVEQQLEALGRPNGFASLATNPPYVKVQTLSHDYRKQLEHSNPAVTTGSYSLATIFLSRMEKYLAPGGLSGVITMNNVFTSLSGVGLRRKWQADKSITRIVDFRHFKVFQASAYTCLIYSGTRPHDTFEFAAVNDVPSLGLLEKLSYSDIHFKSLAEKKWRMTSNASAALLASLERSTDNLSTICDIKVGIATLADKAFIVTEVETGKYLATGGDGVTRYLENQVVKPLVKISDLSESSDFSHRGVIFPYSSTSTGFELMDTSEFKTLFPVAHEHLNSWKQIIYKPSRKGQKLHEWGRRQGMSSPGPKLFTKTFDKKPTFHLDTSDSLFCNGYSLTFRGAQIGNIGALIGLQHYLQSRFMAAYALMTSFEIDGGYQCYQKNFIEKFAVPKIETLIGITGRIEPASMAEALIAQELGVDIADLDRCLEDYGFNFS